MTALRRILMSITLSTCTVSCSLNCNITLSLWLTVNICTSHSSYIHVVNSDSPISMNHCGS